MYGQGGRGFKSRRRHNREPDRRRGRAPVYPAATCAGQAPNPPLCSKLGHLVRNRMKDLFLGFYRPTDAELEEAWKQCVFVLDANVLLNLYRYPQQARDDLLGIFAALRDRLWVPHFAALEYQRNRLNVIAEQKKRFREVREAVDRVVSGLDSEFSRLQLRDRHSLIDPDLIIAEIRPLVDKYKIELASLEEGQGNVHQRDEIREKLEEVIGLCVGTPPTQEAVAAICREGERRFAVKMPPGFMDSAKGDGSNPVFTYGGVSYESKYGDLIIWKQIIEFSLSDPGRYIVFLTDDEKDDWWLTVDSQGRKRIGARPELIDEICREGKAGGFYMYNSARFLAKAKDYLSVQVSDKSIDQVREVAAREASRTDMARIVEVSQIGNGVARGGEAWAETLKGIGRFVFNWVVDQNPASTVALNQGWPDILAEGPFGRVGYEVFVVTTPSSFPRRVRREIDSGHHAVANGALVRHEIVAVAAHPEQLDAVSEQLSAEGFELPEGVMVTLGTISGPDGGSPAFMPSYRVSQLGRRKTIEILHA